MGKWEVTIVNCKLSVAVRSVRDYYDHVESANKTRKSQSLLRFGEIDSKIQSIDQMAVRKSDANLKEFNKKAPKRALCFQNRPIRAHKACTPIFTWSGSHARRVRFRDLETYRNSSQNSVTICCGVSD